LKKNLQKILKKYDFVVDIIIFGSYLKGRDNPKDIDLAFIVKEKEIDLIPSIKKDLGIDKVHLEFILVEKVYSNTLFLSLLNEGYSVREETYLRKILGTRPMRLYSYDLKHLATRSQKTLFGIALNKTLVKVNGKRIGIGVILIPIRQTSFFEDFLEVWGLKYKTREWTVF